MKHYIVDENGEVVKELNEGIRLVEVNNGDRIVRSTSIKSYKDRQVETKKVDSPFIKLNTRWIDEAFDKCPLFGFLLRYICYEDNMLLFSNGKPINAANLSRVTPLSYSTCRRQLDMLLKRDILKKVRTNGKYIYYLNPFIAMCGKRMSIETINMFNGSKYKEGAKVE